MEQRVHTGVSVRILRKDWRHFHFHLVPPMDANTNQGKLSVATPLGKALLGRRPGEEFSYEVPGGSIHVKLLEVEPTAD
jgi:transcription elongation GreA/GreB family factor